MSSADHDFRVEDARDDLPFQIHWELDDAPLSVDAFRVYAHFVRRAGRDGLIHPGYLSIGETCFRATLGPNANPRSLRNRAMKAVRELEAIGLIAKKSRVKKASSENDTNIYTLTPKRQWLDELKRRGMALVDSTKAAKEGREVGPDNGGKRARGGIPTMPPSIPTMPKVISTEVLTTEEKRGGVFNVAENAHEGSGPGAPVAEPLAAPHSSSEHLAEPTAAPSTADVAPQAAPAPDGEAADAAQGEDLSITDEDLAQLFGEDETLTSPALEEVPGGPGAGAAGEVAPSGDGEAPSRPSIATLAPIPDPELLSRPVGAVGGEVWKALHTLFGAQMQVLLNEETRTRQLSRERWLRLTGSEVQEIKLLAQAEAKQDGGNMITLAIRGLDRRIGAVATPTPAGSAGGKRPTFGDANAPVGPVDLSHLDPQLPEGARCTVGRVLGVVYAVTNLGYIVDLDGGERVTVDRAVAAALKSLKASSAPAPAPRPAAPVVIAPVGSRYREVKTGVEVEVRATDGNLRRLSNGGQVPMFTLTNDRLWTPI